MNLIHGFFIEEPLEKPAQRIISLVPSQTELLFDLGLEEQVVGITKFCVHPKIWHQEKTKIGGTKTVNFDIIKSLKPDLIIGNKEENTKEMMNGLSEIAPVWISDIQNIVQATEMISQIGILTDRLHHAEKIAERIKDGFQELTKLELQSKTAAYFIWRNPWMCVGNNTFIDHLFPYLSLKNVYADQTRYPEITLLDLVEKNPEYILLSSEPFPFKEKHADEIKAILPTSKIIFVDGEMFSWYGSRLQFTPHYFKNLLKEISIKI